MLIAKDSDESWCAGTILIAPKEHHMPTYGIDTENNLAVHRDRDAAIKEAGDGTAFATEASAGGC